MPLLASNATTLADISRALGPDGTLAPWINIASQSNGILDTMQWAPGNLPTGNRTTQLVGLPQGTFRLLNRGVQPTTERTATVMDTSAMLETFSVVDRAAADMTNDPQRYRLNRDRAFMQGIAQQLSTALFYGNTAADPAAFNGLAVRYNSLSAPTGANVLDALGTGSNNTSIWLVVWGEDAICGMYPKGSVAGLQVRDVSGDQPIVNADGTRFMAYQTHFKWDCGLMVNDWRYAVRVCNIDVPALRAGTGANVINQMIEALARVPVLPSGTGAINGTAGMGAEAAPVNPGNQAFFYMNRRVLVALQQQFRSDPRAYLTIDMVAGKPITSFLGVPCVGVDSILNTEARVV